MGYIVTNAFAILVATFAGLVVGAVYAVLQGWRGRSPTFIATAAVAEFWLACILAGALILAPPQAGAWTMALGSAVVIWIGFVLPSVLLTLRWRDVRWTSALADSFVWLAVMAAQAAVLHLIGLTKPG